MNQPLTQKQKNILNFIRQYGDRHEKSPTLEELRAFCNVGSINTVVDHLKALEQKGYIVRRKHSKRNIELRESLSHNSKTTITIPVTASVGCDDLSVCANEQHDEFIEVDRSLLRSRSEYVAVRAVGNSMNDANIHNGDYILVQITDNVDNGDRIVAVVGDMVTVKRFERHDGVVVLRPESRDPQYKPIIVGEDFKISGKVVCTIPGKSMDMTEIVPIKNTERPHGAYVNL